MIILMADPRCTQRVTLWQTNTTQEHHHVVGENYYKWGSFNSYVKLLEGMNTMNTPSSYRRWNMMEQYCILQSRLEASPGSHHGSGRGTEILSRTSYVVINKEDSGHDN